MRVARANPLAGPVLFAVISRLSDIPCQIGVAQ